MKLNRRYKHNLKHNLSFYLATVILTAVSIFLFLSILTTGTGLDGYVTDFAQRHNMEDAQFSTLMPIEKADRKDLEKKYDLTLEQTGYVDVEEKDYTVRVLKRNQKIDTYEIFEGKDVVDDDEIVLSKGFAQANDLAIGDKLELDGKQYTITGFLLRPDYINCLENLTDAYRNNEGFAVAAVSDDTYDKLEEDERIWCATCKEGFEKPGCERVEVETDGENPQHAGVLNAFAAHIQTGAPLVADGREGINGLMLSNAIHLSSWLGETVTLPIDEKKFLNLLNERRAHSRLKEDTDVVMDTASSYGGGAK